MSQCSGITKKQVTKFVLVVVCTMHTVPVLSFVIDTLWRGFTGQ